MLDPQAFLQLLVAQLKYQDPTNPVDTSSFMNQTAMLSQVQTMNSMQSTLSSLVSSQQAQAAPKPPPPIDDSTSALDYKRTLRHRPPPLPAMDLPRSRTAEEAVTAVQAEDEPGSDELLQALLAGT